MASISIIALLVVMCVISSHALFFGKSTKEPTVPPYQQYAPAQYGQYAPAQYVQYAPAQYGQYAPAQYDQYAPYAPVQQVQYAPAQTGQTGKPISLLDSKYGRTFASLGRLADGRDNPYAFMAGVLQMFDNFRGV